MSTIVGIAWYEPGEWNQLRALAPGAEKLEPTHAEWRAFADKGLADLRAAGYDPRRVPVKVAALQASCEALGRPPDASARAEYASAELQRLHEAWGTRPRRLTYRGADKRLKELRRASLGGLTGLACSSLWALGRQQRISWHRRLARLSIQARRRAVAHTGAVRLKPRLRASAAVARKTSTPQPPTMRTRAFRRHHDQRIRQRVAHYFGGIGNDPRR